jgi:hypothetical protein
MTMICNSVRTGICHPGYPGHMLAPYLFCCTALRP